MSSNSALQHHIPRGHPLINHEDELLNIHKLTITLVLWLIVFVGSCLTALNAQSTRGLSYVNTFRSGSYLAVTLLYLIPFLYDSFAIHSSLQYVCLALFFTGYVLNLSLSFVLFDAGTCREHIASTLSQLCHTTMLTSYGTLPGNECLGVPKTQGTAKVFGDPYFALHPAERIAVVASEEKLAREQYPVHRKLLENSPIPYTYSLVTLPTFQESSPLQYSYPRSNKKRSACGLFMGVYTSKSLTGASGYTTATILQQEIDRSPPLHMKKTLPSEGDTASSVSFPECNGDSDREETFRSPKQVSIAWESFAGRGGKAVPGCSCLSFFFTPSSRMLLVALSFHTLLESQAIGVQRTISGVYLLAPSLLMTAYTDAVVLSFALQRYRIPSSESNWLLLLQSLFAPCGVLLGMAITVYGTPFVQNMALFSGLVVEDDCTSYSHGSVCRVRLMRYVEIGIMSLGAGSFLFSGISDAIVSEFPQGRRHIKKLSCFILGIVSLYLQLLCVSPC